MPSDRLSPWSDWKRVDLNGILWGTSINGSPPVSFRPLLAADYAADQLNGTNSGDNADFQMTGGPSWKPTFTGAGSTVVNCFASQALQIPLPDYIIEQQRGRFRSWTGLPDDDMGDDGSLRHCLQIEQIIVSSAIQFDGDTGLPGADLVAYQLGAQFRGYGAPIVATAAQTQDGPVGSGIFSNSGTSAFPDMSLPSDSPSTSNDVPTFGPDGVCRIQSLVELPATTGSGDMVEVVTLIEYASPRVTAVQWYGTKYRFLSQPFPFSVNSSLQLDGSDGVLEPQPRQDELPYEP
jgi:hypothetical protein